MRHLLSPLIALSLLSIPVWAQQSHPPEQPTQAQDATPRRLTISVSVAEPSDVKVGDGDRVEVGQLIADRGRERRRLENQKAQLALTLNQIQSATITPPQTPVAVPAIASLPLPNYLEEEAAIERAKSGVHQAESVITAKQQELTYLANLPNLDPLILEHETAKLEQLQHGHTTAVRDYQLAVGKLAKSQNDADYQEYRHSLDLAERVERANQVALTYQRQWAEYEERLRNRDYQVAQTQLRLGEIDNAIASLSVVRAPYTGMVRRVKWLGQDSSGLLSAEITLLVTGDGTVLEPTLSE